MRLKYIILILAISYMCVHVYSSDQKLAQIPLENNQDDIFQKTDSLLEQTDPNVSDEERFMSWLRSCGASINGVEIKKMEGGGRGVFLVGEPEAFSEIARIPLTCSITSQGAIEHPELKPIWESNPGLASGRSPMAVQLLYERNKGEKSSMYPWIKLLPQTLDTPVMWKREERQWLKGSYVLDRALADIEGLTEDYEKVFVRGLFKSNPEMFNETNYSLEDYFWAWNIIWSRYIEQRIAGNWEAFLTPFVDMMNHQAEDGADLYINFGRTDLIVRLNGSLSAGQELTRTYIPSSPNIELFRMYGFIDPQNPYIVSAIKFEFDKNEKYYNRRLAWAKKYKLDIETEYPYNDIFVTNRGIPPNIPALLRIANYKFDKRDSWTSLKDAPDPYKILENNVEQQFFSYLREQITERLKQFETTIEEDERILENKNLPQRYQLAVEVRLEEKIALTGAFESLATQTVKFDEPINLQKGRPTKYPKRAASRSSNSKAKIGDGQAAKSEAE